MDRLEVTADTYRKQETHRFRNAAQTHGIIYYRTLNIFAFPVITYLTNDYIDNVAVFSVTLIFAIALNLFHLVTHLFGIEKFNNWSRTISFDICLLFFLAILSGGIESEFRYLYLLIILFSITEFSRRISYSVGLMSIAAFTLLVWLGVKSSGMELNSILTHLFILICISFVSGEIAELVNKMRVRTVDAVLEQIDANKKVIEQNDRLEEIVAERTCKLERANRLLEELSFQDPLSGIPNRRYYDKQIEIEWRRALREHKPLSLLMIDIDHFKQYNDTYGHAQGDECLRIVAKMIQTQLHRPGDFVARYGGEEFVVILPSTDLEGAKVTAERIRTSIELLKMENKNASSEKIVTISMGISVVVDDINISLDEYKEQADKALYSSKENGRNCYSVWK